MSKKLTLFDTTLRDGEQSEGISFTVHDKVKIVKLLDDIGIDYIEGGWPAANPKAMEFFNEIKKTKLKNAKIVAFGSTCRADNPPVKDKNLQGLLAVKTPTVCIFGKTWDLHVTHALNISLEKNLKIIEDSILFLKSKKKEVFYDAEHFFDGYKADPEYALKTILAAQKAGADVIILCDTNGGTLPQELPAIIKFVKQNIIVPLGIHAHNDSETAVANSVMAVEHGITHVQGTINGYGERCGNANLCSIIPALNLKMGTKALTDKQLTKLTELSHHISEIANLVPNDHQAYVGRSAFTHKGGIHVSAVLKESSTYEHIIPEKVGNKQRVLISEMAGVSNLIYKAKEFGVDLKKDNPHIRELLNKIKKLEHAGYQFEEGEASFELLMKKALGKYKPLFTLEGFRVVNEKLGGNNIIVEATIKVDVKGQKIITAAEGNGPVSALDNALRKALEKYFPDIKKIHLSDYKVRVLDSKDGTEAKVRVLIESTDEHGNSWGTVGVSANIIEASWEALVDSIEYKLLQ
ncbi:citramalate synthase [Candidatus Margulisiibacteriota bacterium]